MLGQGGRDGSALVAVVTIVDEEFDAIRAIETFSPCPDDSPFLFRKPLAKKQYDVILAQSADRSNTPCAELVADLAERYRPEYIVLSGTFAIFFVPGTPNLDIVTIDRLPSEPFEHLINVCDESGRGFVSGVASSPLTCTLG
jgi:hypothetical protein